MQINILGTRGVPAQHGGFETFAAEFALYLRDKGYDVLVYCEAPSRSSTRKWEDDWKGVKRVFVSPRSSGALGTMEFDLACAFDVLKRPGSDLVLGYNTALFNIIQRLRGRRVVMNMDGIEWKRKKWGFFARVWFLLNEQIGLNISSDVIADHPGIVSHLNSRTTKKPIMIPYGADEITSAQEGVLKNFDLEKYRYFISIARIEPENSILELVEAHTQIDADVDLVVLGKLDQTNEYHRKVMAAAGGRVKFPGAVYDREKVQALRYYSTAYLHGHTVGGTNPSLVEALGAGRPVIAHDNPFNRWTAGDDQLFFKDSSSASAVMAEVVHNAELQEKMGAAARKRHGEEFTFDKIHRAYEEALFGSSK